MPGGPRDRLAKLVAQLGLKRDARVWSVTCFLVAPPWRHRGVATALLEAAIAAAESAGARRLEAYPRADEHDDQWTGPLALYVRRGFVVRAPGTPRSIVSLDLASPLVGRR